MILDASGNLVSSTVSNTELALLSGISNPILDDSDRGVNNGLAELDANGVLTSAQIPPIAITSTYVVADETAQLALTVQEGDVAVRTDENKSYIALNADNVDMGDWQVLLTPTDAVQSVNGETGTVVLDTDHLSDAGKTNKFVTAGDITNLGNLSNTNSGDVAVASSAEINTGTDNVKTISALGLAGSQLQTDVTANNSKVSADGLVTTHSDVSDAGSGIIISGAERTTLGTALQSGDNISVLTNDSSFVDAAGAKTAAVVNSTAGSETDQAASVAAMKTYVGSNGGNLAAGDIKQTSFTGADTASNVSVTSLAFANGVTRSFVVQLTVIIDTTADEFEVFTLTGIQKAASWDMSVESVGDDSLVSFSITAAGQIQYSKTASAGTFVSNTMKFRADTVEL